MKNLKLALEDLVNVLESEKKFLINDDLSNLIEIIKTKEKKVEELSCLLEENGEKENFTQEIKNLILEVKNLQDTNFLLTEQAMSYHTNFMDNILKVLEESSKANTYSKDGNYENKNESSIIDKQV